MSWWAAAAAKLGLSSASIAIGAATGVAVGVVAGVLVTGGDPAPAATEARAWIDQPLDGARLPVGPIHITVHAADPDGLATVVVTIDGAPIHEESPTRPATLVTVETTWDPSGPGQFEVGAVGRDGSGTEGSPAVATIVVGHPDAEGHGDDSTTSTSTTSADPARNTTLTSSTSSTVPIVVGTIVTGSTIPTGTTSPPTTIAVSTTSPRTTVAPTTVPPTTSPRTTVPPTTSPRTTVPPTTSPPTTAPPTTAPPTTVPATTVPPTTQAPCVPGVPILISPPDGGPVFTATPTLSWEYRGCGPASFTVQVADNSSFLQGRGSYVRTVTVSGSVRSVTWESLACPLDYFWRVLATDSGGSSAWSPARSFFADC